MIWRSIKRFRRTELFRCALLLLLSAPLLAGCLGLHGRPDLRRLYQSANVVEEQPPLILVPGIMGSRLRDIRTHRMVWPGNLWRIAFHSYAELGLDIDPRSLEAKSGDLEAYALAESVGGEHFYDTIIHTLVQSGSFVLTRPGTPIRDPYTRHLYLFPYDWRLDNVESARKLSALIDQLRLDYGRPDLKVDIVAHSMGGIVSRYLLQFGTEDVLGADDPQPTMVGASRINRLILLGTPNLGSANTIEDMVVGARLVLARIEPQTLATMPSVYELLPNPDRKPLLGIDGRALRTSEQDGSSPERGLFDVQTWRALQWSVFDPALIARLGVERSALLQRYFAKYLQRAGRLQRALAREQPASSVKLIVFGADCRLTPSRVLLEEDRQRLAPRFEVRQIKRPMPGKDYDELMREPGDGLVTKASLLGRQSLDPTLTAHGGFPVAFSFFLCSEHSAIPGNINFQDNLLNAILAH
jgi:pimeloyl-ACP methyl ester carboxylesterase